MRVKIFKYYLWKHFSDLRRTHSDGLTYVYVVGTGRCISPCNNLLALDFIALISCDSIKTKIKIRVQLYSHWKPINTCPIRIVTFTRIAHLRVLSDFSSHCYVWSPGHAHAQWKVRADVNCKVINDACSEMCIEFWVISLLIFGQIISLRKWNLSLPPVGQCYLHTHLRSPF